MRRDWPTDQPAWPKPLQRPFEIIAFDWDGTAVPNRTADATLVRHRIERLLQLGVYIAIITGTNFGNVDRQLTSAISGPHKRRLYVLTDRGSTVYGFDHHSRPTVLAQRLATPEEDRLLTTIAERVRDLLQARTGLEIAIVYDRLNRRKIDLIPLPEWRDPPKAALGELARAVEERLRGAGLSGGLSAAIELAVQTARELGLPEARITSDVKHIEVGLSDKSDAAAWVLSDLAGRIAVAEGGRPVPPQRVLFAGDEFGPIAGLPGSDALLCVPAARSAVFVSVGPEPNGVPPGVLHLGGGPPCFQRLLEDQIARWERHLWGPGLGSPTLDPTWVVFEEGFDPVREREVESRLTVANGYLGTRGAVDEGSPHSEPGTLIAGFFDLQPPAPAALEFVVPATPVPELVVAPDWTRLQVVVGDAPLRLDVGEVLAHRRTLDLRRGMLLREWRQRDPAGRISRLTTVRLASLADRHALVQLATLVAENYAEQVALVSGVDGRVARRGGASLLPFEAVRTATGPRLAMRTRTSGRIVAFDVSSRLHARSAPDAPQTLVQPDWVAERWTWLAQPGRSARLAKLATVYTSREVAQPLAAASAHLERLQRRGPTPLVRDHQRAWQERLEDADVRIVGDDAAQRALRFAEYHLIATANPEDERTSIGARLLSGHAYQGHVFWDTELFMLPFFIYTHPPSARAMLMYRYHTLPAAREKARSLGYRGALYAWESAESGAETTPLTVLSPTGEVVPIWTGLQEHHISADVAYAVWHYWQATGDDAFLLVAGAEILLETARFWASRATREADGRYHIRRVIGPDEYHEGVDDNAYTNWLARWNLEQGRKIADWLRARWPGRWAALAERLGLTDAELEEWAAVARGLVDNLDPATGLIAQHAGFLQLERVDLADYEPRSVPIDVILGRERTQQTQVIKQADVVMLLHLFWSQLDPRVREVNFRYYEPICGHGSSLSPAIHALVAARLGDLPLAERYFHQAATIDLGDTFGNTAGGVHAAALGGLWQAVVFGCAGLELRDDGLGFTPNPLPRWRSLTVPLQWRGRRLRVTITQPPVAIEVALLAGGEPLQVTVAGGSPTLLAAERPVRARRAPEGWEYL